MSVMTEASTPTCLHETCVATSETSRMTKGLCHFHYLQFLRYGETYDGRRNARKQCGAKDCDRPTVAHGLCEKHYRPAHRRQRLHESKRKLNRSCSKCGGPIPPTAKYGTIFCSKECKTATGNLYRAMRTYGITLDEYEATLNEQNGGCAICGISEDTLTRRLAVDHDHETGRVRGLLCMACNTALGHLKDDPAVLRSAIAYLER